MTNEILVTLWADKIPRILFWNKIDLIKSDWEICYYLPEKYKKFNPIFISALDKIWIEELKNKIEKNIFPNL